jgi:Big-like domain-containing protein
MPQQTQYEHQFTQQVNHLPIVHNMTVDTIENKPVIIAVNATDRDDDDLTATIVSPPKKGTLSRINQSDGSLTYTPESDFIGSDSFKIKVSDGWSDSNIGNISINVYK